MRKQIGAVLVVAAAIAAYAFTASVVAPRFDGARPLVDAPAECPSSPRPPDTDALRARIGAYYFGGWSGPTSGRHFDGLEAFPARQPLSGWQDMNTTSMEQQLRWARAYGLSFFAFDWYHDAAASSDPFLNTALGNYLSLRHRDRAGVRFAVVYVNTNDGEDFVVPRRAWTRVTRHWATLFRNRDYVRVAGKPLFIVLDAIGMERQLGSSAAVNDALAALRTAARAQGLPGVFAVGGITVDRSFDWRGLQTRLAGQRWNALTQYAYPAITGAAPGARRFDEVVHAEGNAWASFAASTPYPYVPDVMVGWDPRPWNEKVQGRLFWFRRNPAGVAAFVNAAIDWAAAHRPPSEVGRPIVMLEAWNELGEGSYIVPTIGDCHAYGAALARVVSVPGEPHRS